MKLFPINVLFEMLKFFPINDQNNRNKFYYSFLLMIIKLFPVNDLFNIMKLFPINDQNNRI